MAEGVKALYEMEKCPECGGQWDGGDVLSEVMKANRDEEKVRNMNEAKQYGWNEYNRLKFTNIREIYTPSSNIPMYIQCPHCARLWRTSSGALLDDHETKTAYKMFIREEEV